MNTRMTWIILFISLSILACRAGEVISLNTVVGSGNLSEETRIIEGVTRVELATSGTLYITIGEPESLTIKADDNLLQYIRTQVQGDTLTIDLAKNLSISKNNRMEYYLTTRELQAISISSSGDVDAPSISTDKFEIKISSSGDVQIAGLVAKTLKADITSSGNITIEDGEIDKQEIKISSSGDYEARNVSSLQAKVTLTSSGSATIQVQERITADLGSSGDLYYLGSPTLEVNTSSSGRVIQIED